MRKAISILLLVFGCFVGTASAQTGSIVITATSTPASITVDRNCNYVVIQENSATPTNAFTITLPGQSTGVTYQAGYRFVFTAGPSGFNKGQTIGTISIASGSVQFIGIESDQTPTIPASARGLYFQDGGTPIGTADTINCSGCSISGTTATIVGGGSGCIPGGSAGALQKNSNPTGSCAAAALVDNAGTITASEPVYCNNLGNVRCIDPTNLAGWSGSDAGAWINSARTDCGTQDCSIKIAPGTYSVSTPITFTHNTALLCPGPATFTGTSFLNWLPATGTMISVSSGVTFMMDGCRLEAPNNTGSVALLLGRVIYKTVVENFRINGFTGGIRVTGDGVSLTSTGVDIENGYISGFCGTGSYAINADHVGDLTIDKVQAYSTTDCATSIPLILDTDVGGAWLSNSTFEQGLHAGIIRNTNQGGAYGGAPAAIFPTNITWDTATGGDNLLFDSSLGTSDIRFFCTACWLAGAGLNQAGSVVTSSAVGANIQGGSNIHFVGGTARANASWGFELGGSGNTSLSIDASNIYANNQGNTAGVGGVLVGSGPSNWRITNTRGGDTVETGGHQYWGVDLSSASNTGYVCSNDLATNITNQYNLAPFSTMSTNPNICGTGAGLVPWGPLQIAQNASPVNPSSGFDLLNFASDIFGPLTSAGAFAGGKFGSLNDTGLGGSTQCVESVAGVITGTGAACAPVPATSYRQYTTSTTLSSTDSGIVDVKCASGCTITLPASVPAAYWATSIQWDPSGAGAVTINPNGKNMTICTNAASTSNFTMPTAGGSVYISTDGTSWFASCPLQASTNVTIAPATTGLQISASSTGSTAFSALTASTNSNAGTFAASGNTWDFSAASVFKVPVAALFAPTASGSVGYDSTNNKWVFGQNGATVSFGLSSSACSTHQWVNTPATSTATASCSQPAFSDISGTLALNSAVFANQGTTTTVLHGNAAGNLSFGAVTPSDASGNTSGSGNFCLVTSCAMTTPNLGTPSAINLANATSLPCAAMPALTGDVTTSAGACATTIANNAVTGAKMANNTVTATQLASQYSKRACPFGMGDGTNAITAATYPSSGQMLQCVNNSGVTWTITGIHCFTDNAGTSTLNVYNNAGTSLLTGAITCNATKTSGGAAGTQSATTTIANTDGINFVFVADGTSKYVTATVDFTY